MDIQNSDIFEGVINVRTVLDEVNQKVGRNNQDVQETKNVLFGMTTSIASVQASLQQLLRDSPSQQRNSIPRDVTKFYLPPTKKENIQHILEDSMNVIGNGGFGTVRLGTLNGQKVAVKVLNQNTQEGNIL